MRREWRKAIEVLAAGQSAWPESRSCSWSSCSAIRRTTASRAFWTGSPSDERWPVRSPTLAGPRRSNPSASWHPPRARCGPSNGGRGVRNSPVGIEAVALVAAAAPLLVNHRDGGERMREYRSWSHERPCSGSRRDPLVLMAIGAAGSWRGATAFWRLGDRRLVVVAIVGGHSQGSRSAAMRSSPSRSRRDPLPRPASKSGRHSPRSFPSSYGFAFYERSIRFAVVGFQILRGRLPRLPSHVSS